MNDEILLQVFSSRSQSLRIALVTETYPPEINGVAMTLGRQVDELQRRGHQIQLIRPKQGVFDVAVSNQHLEEVLKPGVPIPRYAGLKLGLPAKAALVKLWRFKRPDLVHIATEGPLGWSALSAAQKLRLPVSTDFHTNFHSYSRHYGAGWLRRPILAYLRKFHNKACVTLVPTNAIREELQQHGYQNLEVVARGVDTELFHPDRRDATLRALWGVLDDTPVVLYVGRLAAEKNLPLVFSAFDAMRQENQRLKLVLVGDGPELSTLKTRYPDAIFCGLRRDEDLARHYASADIFLFPSLTETFGNVTTEAMASGLAVIAYDYAAAEALIQHRINGLVAAPQDSTAFIREAVSLVTDPSQIKGIGRNAFQTALSISWPGVHDRFERVLQTLVERESNHGEIKLAMGS